MNQHSKLSLGGPSTAASSRLLVASGNLTRRTFLGAAVRLGLAGAGLPLVSSCTWAIARPTPAAVRAQIGVLSTGAGPEVPEFEALRRGLGELGYEGFVAGGITEPAYHRGDLRVE